jgi:hypothetical protein
MLTHPGAFGAFSGWVARGSAPPLAAACGRGLTSAALIGAAISRSAPGKDAFQSHQGNITRKKYTYLSYFHIKYYACLKGNKINALY